MTKSEIRKDYILERYVVISSKRAKRPSDVTGREKKGKPEECIFCPGNEHNTPKEIYQYPKKNWRIRVIPNKYPIMFAKNFRKKSKGLLTSFTSHGSHEVVIETPDHNFFQDFSLKQIRLYLRTLLRRYKDLMKEEETMYVVMFKNHGKKAGASIAHEHSQIISSPVFPKQVSDEMSAAQEYYEKEKRCPFCDVIKLEKKNKKRVVYQNDHFIAFCPFAPRWHYETWIFPKRHFSDFDEIRKTEINDLAKCMKAVVSAYSNIFDKPAYNILYHFFPSSDFWHFHLELLPRTSKTFASSEFFELFVNEMAPEDAAEYLRKAKT